MPQYLFEIELYITATGPKEAEVIIERELNKIEIDRIEILNQEEINESCNS